MTYIHITTCKLTYGLKVKTRVEIMQCWTQENVVKGNSPTNVETNVAGASGVAEPTNIKARPKKPVTRKEVGNQKTRADLRQAAENKATMKRGRKPSERINKTKIAKKNSWKRE